MHCIKRVVKRLKWCADVRHGAEQPTEEDVVADGQNRGSNKDAERQTVGNDHAQQLSPRSDVELRVGIEDRHGRAEEQQTIKKKAVYKETKFAGYRDDSIY